MFKYWGFGLNITSEIEFPELLPATFENADVTIATGKTPDKLEGEHVIKRTFSYVSDSEYLLNLKTVCRYHASNGNKVVIEPVPGIDEHSVRLFLLGTVMAAILYQRGSIPLHASAINRNGKLILFAGNSGVGKSTLIASLATKGYDIFTDDICVLQYSQETNQVLGTASYPMLKLWEDAIERLDTGSFNKEFKVRPLLPKYGQFFYDKFNQDTLPVEKIFILSAQNNAGRVDAQKMPLVEAFGEVEKQAYKNQLIANNKLRAVHFSLLTQVINHVPVFKVTRPLTGATVEAVVEAIEKLF